MIAETPHPKPPRKKSSAPASKPEPAASDLPVSDKHKAWLEAPPRERKPTHFDPSKMHDKMFDLHPIDILDLLAKKIPRPPELVQGILHQGSKMVIGGGSKSFKTWTLLDLALSVATGVPWWGFETTKGKVLYVNFEIQDAFFQERVNSIIEAKDTTLERGQFTYLGLRGTVTDAGFPMKRLEKATKDKELALIIIDPIYKGLGKGDENKAGDIAALMNELESLAVESGAAVTFGHHFSKGNQAGKDAMDRMSGSGVFARDPDSILMMTQHEDENVFVVDCILRNLPPVDKFCVAREHPLMIRSEEHDPTKLKQVRGNEEKYSDEEILTPLREEGSLTFSEWREVVCTRSGMGKRTFANRLKKLLEEGAVKKDGDNYIEVTKATTRINEKGSRVTSFVQKQPDSK